MAQKASTHGRSHHLWLPALLRIATGVLGSIPSHPLAYNCCEALVDGLLSLTIPARDTVSTNPSINAKQDAHTCVVLETVQSLVEQCHVFRDVSLPAASKLASALSQYCIEVVDLWRKQQHLNPPTTLLLASSSPVVFSWELVQYQRKAQVMCRSLTVLLTLSAASNPNSSVNPDSNLLASLDSVILDALGDIMFQPGLVAVFSSPHHDSLHSHWHNSLARFCAQAHTAEAVLNATLCRYGEPEI
jgi:hypothetical protein